MATFYDLSDEIDNSVESIFDMSATSTHWGDERPSESAHSSESTQVIDDLKCMDGEGSEQIILYDGLHKNGRPSQLVRTRKDDTAVSLEIGEEASREYLKDEDTSQMRFKRSLHDYLGLELDESIAKFMARRKSSITTAAKNRCNHAECGKEFKRACDLTKHEQTHKRPWKCSDSNCRYSEYGLPTEKELNRHVLDKHGPPKLFKCLFPPCEYSSKRESNCKQHMEKAHGWSYATPKNNRNSRDDQALRRRLHIHGMVHDDTWEKMIVWLPPPSPTHDDTSGQGSMPESFLGNDTRSNTEDISVEENDPDDEEEEEDKYSKRRLHWMPFKPGFKTASLATAQRLAPLLSSINQPKPHQALFRPPTPPASATTTEQSNTIYPNWLRNGDNASRAFSAARVWMRSLVGWKHSGDLEATAQRPSPQITGASNISDHARTNYELELPSLRMPCRAAISLTGQPPPLRSPTTWRNESNASQTSFAPLIPKNKVPQASSQRWRLSPIRRPFGSTKSLVDGISGTVFITFVTSILGSIALLFLGAGFMLSMQEAEVNYTAPRWLPKWVNGDFLSCVTSSSFLILGLFVSFVQLLKYACCYNEIRQLRFVCIWIALSSSCGLSIASMATFNRSKAGSTSLGGLAAACQVLVIFLGDLMKWEREVGQMAAGAEIPLMEMGRESEESVRM